MSYQFHVTRIEITTGPAVAEGHDGQPYVNKSIPTGTVLAIDTKGHTFAYVGPTTGADDWGGAATKKPRKLFRDYWRWVANVKVYASPSEMAMRNAPRRVLWQQAK